MNIYKEITPLRPQDTLVVIDSVRNGFDYPIHNHSEYEINLVMGMSGSRIVGDSTARYTDFDLVLLDVHRVRVRERAKLHARRIDERVHPGELEAVQSFAEREQPRLLDQRQVRRVVNRELHRVAPRQRDHVDARGSAPGKCQEQDGQGGA